MMKSCVRGVLVSLLVVLVSQSTVSGDLVFDLEWGPLDPGAGMGSAVGVLTVDETGLLNPTSSAKAHSSTPFVLDFEMTVSGAISGNGTFVFSDFGDFYWHTAGVTLDLSTELVGQTTPGGPWGTPNGLSGDFNVFGNSASSAPTGTFFFTTTTNCGSGEQLVLTSFRPAAVVPAPSALVLSLIGMVSLGAKRWRRKV